LEISVCIRGASWQIMIFDWVYLVDFYKKHKVLILQFSKINCTIFMILIVRYRCVDGFLIFIKK